MAEFFSKLFDTGGFPPRWYCGQWSSGHGWLHIVSDVAVFAAYTAIPCVLAYYALKRRDIVFNKVVWLFVAFIFACGSVHLVEAAIFWHPVYRVSGMLKFGTAIVSWMTVIALIKIAPAALRLPGLATVNAKLEVEIEERRRAERRLEQLAASLHQRNRELDEFAYLASHDLRSPLRAVDNLARWIDEDSGEDLPEAAASHLPRMRDRIQRMKRLLDDLLIYSRAGRERGTPESVDTGSLVRGIISMIEVPQGINVTVDPDMPTIETLKIPLETCLRNLVDNAVKHRDRPAGHVRISCVKSEDTVEFCVADDGPGIGPEHHERVFAMFATLSAETSDSSGIGLPIIKRIAHSVGGDVRLESELGAGSTFFLKWPRQIESETLDESECEPARC